MQVAQVGGQAGWVALTAAAAAAGPLPTAAAAAVSRGAGEGEGRGAQALVQPAAGVHGSKALQSLAGRLLHVRLAKSQGLGPDCGLGRGTQRVLLRALRAAAGGGLQHEPLLAGRRALPCHKPAQKALHPERPTAISAWRGCQQRRVGGELIGRQRIRQREKVWAGPGLELYPPPRQRPSHHLPVDRHTRTAPPPLRKYPCWAVCSILRVS